jgi:hypothetical protein
VNDFFAILKDRMGILVCACVRARARARVCVCVCEGEREQEQERERFSASSGGYTLVTLPRIVTPYRDSVDGTRDSVNVSKVGYAVTLRAC